MKCCYLLMVLCEGQPFRSGELVIKGCEVIVPNWQDIFLLALFA